MKTQKVKLIEIPVSNKQSKVFQTPVKLKTDLMKESQIKEDLTIVLKQKRSDIDELKAESYRYETESGFRVSRESRNSS